MKTSQRHPIIDIQLLLIYVYIYISLSLTNTNTPLNWLIGNIHPTTSYNYMILHARI